MKNITKHNVQVQRTARYFTLNAVTADTKHIWVVFHGYGQLGEYFIRHFRQLDPKAHTIIALEGLSRFYVDGLGGRVGASWMTSEDREDEITDQSGYINAVLGNLGIDPSTEKRLTVLGFSQGATTAVRWMANNRIHAGRLVIWAGQLPHDVAPERLRSLLSGTKVDFCIGTEDEFITNEQVDERMGQLRQLLPQLKVHWFGGKHVMDSATLLKVSQG
ncbi:MAG: dienelactone hydrolase family protein [Flavobacteriales bacterium]|nr:dienelactone hydrolase family protein [Flavobacteriales bacterium]